MDHPSIDVLRSLPTALRRQRAPSLFVALLVFASGCAVLIPSASLTDESGTTSASPSSQPTSETVKPHTLPQALCAYVKCLHGCKPVEGGEAKNGNHGDEDSKNKEGKVKPEKDKDDKEPQKNGTNSESSSQNKEGKVKPEKDKDDKEPQKNGTDEKKADEEKKTENNDKKKEESGPLWYSAHAQATMVTQAHDNFKSPYVGPNSLQPVEHSATSVTGTIFLAMRLCESGSQTTDLVFNPEMAGGLGFSNTTGVADFPNGEITRVGLVEPTPYIARLFVRQTMGFGGEQENVEDAPNLIAGKRDIERLTFLVGKMSASDLVDDNRYSHDPRSQFLPWGIMFNGAWDYPANVRGYTYGVALDYNAKQWALRYGIFAEPRVSNGAELDPNFVDANGQVLELETRYKLCDHPGKVRLLGYANHAHMGDYREALLAMPVHPDITLTRAYRFKYGFGLNWEQELTSDLGVFSRLGWNDGHTESWAFTAIDRVAELGLVVNGRTWCRPKDRVGLAFAVSGLAKDHRDYLAAGGLDFIIGDGRLRYGTEDVLETYYNFEVYKGINITADFQEIFQPAYNRDRGPVFVATLRVHVEI